MRAAIYSGPASAQGQTGFMLFGMLVLLLRFIQLMS